MDTWTFPPSHACRVFGKTLRRWRARRAELSESVEIERQVVYTPAEHSWEEFD